MSPPCLDTFLIPCSLSSSSSCHWSQVFVNFANLPRTSIPCYLCHPRRRRLPPLRVVYASALSSMSLLVDSRLSRLKSSIFACSSRGSVFYLHTHLVGFNSSPYRYHYLRSTSMPSVVVPSPIQPVPSPVASAASSTSSITNNSCLYSLRRLCTQVGIRILTCQIPIPPTHRLRLWGSRSPPIYPCLSSSSLPCRHRSSPLSSSVVSGSLCPP